MEVRNDSIYFGFFVIVRDCVFVFIGYWVVYEVF